MWKVEWTSEIQIKEPFAKGFISDLWQNNMNSSFSPDIVNMRITNGSSIIRNWFITKVASAIWTYVRGIVSNNSTIYVVANSLFHSADLDAGTYTSKWDIWVIELTFDADLVTSNTIDMDVNTVAMTQVPFNLNNDTTLADIATQLVTDFPLIIASASVVETWTSNDRTIRLQAVVGQTISITNIVVAAGASQANWTFTALTTIDTDVEFITFWIYTIILTGSDFPLVFDWTTLTQLTVANIEEGANPRYWAKFANFTFVSGNGTGKENVLYIGVWITAALQTNSFDWISSGSEQITMKGNILWLEWTLNRLYVWTDKTIEFIDKWSLTDTWWVVSFYTSPIWTWEELASHRSIVSAWEKVFYITKAKKIKTINYLQWSVELAIWDLSDRKDQSIQGFMDGMNDDLSETWGYFDKKDNVIKWWLKSKWSLIVDKILVYDITNDTFLPDSWYFYSGMTELEGKSYWWGILNSNTFLDNDWKDDDGFGIEWKRATAKLYLGTQYGRKAFRWVNQAWQYNALSEINIKINVQGKTVFDWAITGSLVADGIAAEMIWDKAIWDTNQTISVIDFVKKIGRWDLNDRGYYIQITYSWNKAGQELSLDSLGIVAKGIWTDELSDK